MYNIPMKLLRKDHRLTLGQRAEKHAESYLKAHGLYMKHRNYHCRFGEIDLIMQEAQTWVFVEVRCRSHNAPVSAIESITPQKMQKIRKTATHFLMRFDEEPDCRFDVIAMSHSDGEISDNIKWFKNAF